MRIFRVEEDAVVDEVTTTERLAGLYDGLHVAAKHGDGDYDLDFGNGDVMRVAIKDGQAQKVDHDSMRTVNLDDMPHKAWDRTEQAAQTKAPISRLGGLFPDENEAVPARESGPQVEEF